jgi:LacI family transcriptional regulator
VFVDVGPDMAGVANIRINYQNGIRQAVQHLAALRHTKIAFITGPPQLRSAAARCDAFKTAMAEIGLSPDLIVVGNHRMEGGMQAFLDLNALAEPPTAILCSNDMTAIGVMREAYEQKVRVPDDLSIVGFDDIRLAEFMIPPLTTIQMSQHELAKIAFQALLNEVGCDPALHERHKYELTTSLVLRRSTALAKPGTPKKDRANGARSGRSGRIVGDVQPTPQNR